MWPVRHLSPRECGALTPANYPIIRCRIADKCVDKSSLSRSPPYSVYEANKLGNKLLNNLSDPASWSDRFQFCLRQLVSRFVLTQCLVHHNPNKTNSFDPGDPVARLVRAPYAWCRLGVFEPTE